MATNENLIPIPGRLHSVAVEHHVAGADEIYDDTQGKLQSAINTEVAGKYTKPSEGIPVSDLAGVGSANGLASLDANGKVPSSQLPSMDYIPTSEKGTASGVATLDSNGKVTSTQLPSLDYVPTNEKGANGGVATLGNDGKVPSAQLPSYVDDVIEGYYYNSKFYEEAAHTTEITPEDGKIYIDLTGNLTYRWGGSAYVEISQSLALGETSSTAFAGNRGVAIEGKIPSAASTSNKLVDSAAMQAALSGKANSSDVYTKTQIDNQYYTVAEGEQLESDVQSAITAQYDEIELRMDSQDAAIAALSSLGATSVSAVPAVGDAEEGKFYCVPGTDSYDVYMKDITVTPNFMRKLATYTWPGTDEAPTKGSQKLISSGGVYQGLLDLFDTQDSGNPSPSSISVGYLWETNNKRKVAGAAYTAALSAVNIIRIKSTKYRLYNFFFAEDIETGTKTGNLRFDPELDNAAILDISNGFEYDATGKIVYLSIITPDESAITDSAEQISKDIIIEYSNSDGGGLPTVEECVGKTLVQGISKQYDPQYSIGYAWDTGSGVKKDHSSDMDVAAFEISAYSYSKVRIQSSVYKLYNFYCTLDKNRQLSKANQRIDPSKENGYIIDLTDGIELQCDETLCLTMTTDGVTPLTENGLKSNVIITKVLYSVEDRLSALENAGLLVPGPNGKKYQIYVADGDNGAELKIMEA